MKPTLFVLAAGMGSRYGGLKQIDGLGPNGETIMDYSIYDAIRAGFGKVVFVIRKDFSEDFKEKVSSKYEGILPIEIVYQDVCDLPAGYECPKERVKPWGTNHAVLMAKEVIEEPFAVINADDFYGRNSYEVLAQELQRMNHHQGEYCMVGYRVGNTLSESGSVARGVCEKDANGYLTGVVERTSIQKVNGAIVFEDENGQLIQLEEDAPVSMNMWGFTPDYFEHSEKAFRKFLDTNLHSEKGEFYIPTVVNDLILSDKASCKVLDTTSKWFGVTYASDRQGVVDQIQELVNRGEYPANLHKEFSKMRG